MQFCDKREKWGGRERMEKGELLYEAVLVRLGDEIYLIRIKD